MKGAWPGLGAWLPLLTLRPQLVVPEYCIHGLFCLMFLCAAEWVTLGLNLPLLLYHLWRWGRRRPIAGSMGAPGGPGGSGGFGGVGDVGAVGGTGGTLWVMGPMGGIGGCGG